MKKVQFLDSKILFLQTKTLQKLNKSNKVFENLEFITHQSSSFYAFDFVFYSNTNESDFSFDNNSSFGGFGGGDYGGAGSDGDW